MRKIPKLRFHYPYLLMFVLGITTIIVCYQIFPTEKTVNLVNFTITFLSLVVALIAFIIATQTYISIDSVNVISQMEGNVLENEHYVTSTIALLREYHMESSQEVGDKIFENLENRFRKKPRTAIEFTDHLQYFIDVIVFFPSLFHSKDKDKYIDRMNKLLDLVDKRKNELLSISTGNSILIKETVNLIKCVMNYQELIHTNEFKIASSLLEVRGSMLKNSVTQTVYYNYLGLFYNKKAMYILRKHFNMEKQDFFDIHVLKDLMKNIDTLNNQDMEMYTMYLLESRNAFKKALDNSKEDIMWQGFIKYNDARSAFFLELVSQEMEDEWKQIMNEAIMTRSKLNILISDTLEYPYQTHLQKAFIYQEYLARLVKINILIAKNDPITDTIGKEKYQPNNYLGLENDPIIKEQYTGEFNKIEDYQNRIKKYLNKRVFSVG